MRDSVLRASPVRRCSTSCARRALEKDVGDEVTIHLDERIA
jgi:hypothetical protein